MKQFSSLKSIDTGEFKGLLRANARLQYIYKGLEKGQVALSHTHFPFEQIMDSTYRVWYYKFSADCENRQEIFGNWFIGNDVILKNVNFCQGIVGKYPYRKDATLPLALCFRHGDHVEEIAVSSNWAHPFLFIGFAIVAGLFVSGGLAYIINRLCSRRKH
ncbi:hypothetical protein O9G_000224 [Rozella allomycis CSF55]|uniref:Uncharacterized protein n=1 Tax=Rozella allomycis (strain CSF55) TaxID=988480 RepID=A0A075AP14_ROZAC|nr:hypothetical protein O9G_000224 [Rozella allomycis CSF55]|eukprot:EPZ31745.1 hypothetical protein O9G_000224 [Rozella allomycis CSF55]